MKLLFYTLLLSLSCISLAQEAEVSNAKIKRLEESYGWVDFAYRADVKNNTDVKKEIWVKVRIFDSDGFELKSFLTDKVVGGGQSKVYTQTLSVRSAMWGKIKNYTVEISSVKNP